MMEVIWGVPFVLMCDDLDYQGWLKTFEEFVYSWSQTINFVNE